MEHILYFILFFILSVEETRYDQNGFDYEIILAGITLHPLRELFKSLDSTSSLMIHNNFEDFLDFEDLNSRN